MFESQLVTLYQYIFWCHRLQWPEQKNIVSKKFFVPLTESAEEHCQLMLLLFFDANSGTIKFYQIISRDISHISPLFNGLNNFVSFCKKVHSTLRKPGLKPLIFSLNFKRVTVVK